MKYLRYKATEVPNHSTEDLIRVVLHAGGGKGLSSDDVLARARIERDLQRSAAAIGAGGPAVLVFEDERAAALQKIVKAHLWGTYVMAVAEFIEAVEAMPSELPKE